MTDIGDADFLAEQAVSVGLFSNDAEAKEWLASDVKKEVRQLNLIRRILTVENLRSAMPPFALAIASSGSRTQHPPCADDGCDWSALLRS